MLVKRLNELRELLQEITRAEPTPTPEPENNRCMFRHEDDNGSLISSFVGNLNNEWVNIDYVNNYKAYPSGEYYTTNNPGQNKYGVYYEDMPAAVANPLPCEPTPDEFGRSQADLNWLLFNKNKRGSVSGVKNASELYEMLMANHRVSKFKKSPNGISTIKTNEVTII